MAVGILQVGVRSQKSGVRSQKSEDTNQQNRKEEFKNMKIDGLMEQLKEVSKLLDAYAKSILSPEFCILFGPFNGIANCL